MNSYSIALIITLNAAVAAAQTPPPLARRVPDTSAAAPAGPAPTLAELMRQNGGSLRRAALQLPADPRRLKSADVGVFAVPEPKPKTMAKHDLLTIIISEQTQSTSDGSTDTKKDLGLGAKLEQFPGLSLGNFALKNTIGSVVPELKASANRNYKGEGTVDRRDTLSARIQAEVIDVKPNGNLRIQARKRIVTDEEEQLIVVSGECNVAQVTPDNTILSTQISDLDIRKSHTGAVRDATRRGWVPRLLDWANPF